MLEALTIIDFCVLGMCLVLCSIIIFTKDIIKVLLSFLSVLFIIGVVFLLFKGGFLFVTQLLLYVGGVSVLLIFVIMLSKRITKDRSLISSNQNIIAGATFSLAMLLGLWFSFSTKKNISSTSIVVDDVKSLGKIIVTDNLISFELLAIFLLIALILASVIAGKKQNV